MIINLFDKNVHPYFISLCLFLCYCRCKIVSWLVARGKLSRNSFAVSVRQFKMDSRTTVCRAILVLGMKVIGVRRQRKKVDDF